MFFDDFGYYNLIVRSIFVVNIDWILVVLNWYLKVRCVLVINFCYMNKIIKYWICLKDRDFKIW